MSFDKQDFEYDNTYNASIPSISKRAEGKPALKCATPSVIRKGLCMLRDKGNQLLYVESVYYFNLGGKMQKDVNLKNHMYGLKYKVMESAIKYGAEIATACDPLAAAIALGGKIGVGASLSKFSASQCAGLIGVIVSSINPQVIRNIHFDKFSPRLLGISTNFAEKNSRRFRLFEGIN